MKLTRKELRRLIVENIRDYTQFRLDNLEFSPEMQKEVDKGSQAGYAAYKKRIPYCDQWKEEAMSKWVKKYKYNLSDPSKSVKSGLTRQGQNAFDEIEEIYNMCKRGFDPNEEAQLINLFDEEVKSSPSSDYTSSARQNLINKRNEILQFTQRLESDLGSNLDPEVKNLYSYLYGQELEGKHLDRAYISANSGRLGSAVTTFMNSHNDLLNKDLSDRKFIELWNNCTLLADGGYGGAENIFRAIISDPENMSEREFQEYFHGEYNAEDEQPEHVRQKISDRSKTKIIDYYEMLQNHSGEKGLKVLDRAYKLHKTKNIMNRHRVNQGEKYFQSYEKDYPEKSKKGFFDRFF